MEQRTLAAIPDDELLRRLAELLQSSRRVESELVAHIAEVDMRRLYAREATPSMFAYCTEVLHLSEAEAYLRIAVARASREHPVLLSLLADGSLHLTGIALLAPHLTAESRDHLLRRAAHRSKRQIEELIAEIAPRPDAPAVIRRLPERRTPQPAPGLAPGLAPDRRTGVSELRPDGARGGTPQLRPDGVDSLTMPLSPTVRPTDETRGTMARTVDSTVEPLGSGRYKVQFTASAQLRDKLERLRALLRQQVPDGDVATIIERLVTEKLAHIEARHFARTSRPKTTLSKSHPATSVAPVSRHIPAAVRRAVHERDGSRCGYVDDSGRRCSERHRLEYHHRHPFGMGGNHSPTNLGLMCRAHNGYLAEGDYGRKAIAQAAARRSLPAMET